MPTDFSTNLGRVRLTIGDFTEPYYLPDEVIEVTLQTHASEEIQAILIWKASLDSLRALIAEASQEASRRREREGGVEIEDYRNERYEALQDLYDYLVAHPPVGSADSEITCFVIGGTSRKESRRIRQDSDIQDTPFGIGSCFDDIPGKYYAALRRRYYEDDY